MKSLICTAAAAWLLATPAWAHDAHAPHAAPGQAQVHPAAPSSRPAAAPLDAHTREDADRHRGMARAHEQAAQCLEQGQPYEVCQKQLQTSCKGLALGKNCGMRHSH